MSQQEYKNGELLYQERVDLKKQMEGHIRMNKEEGELILATKKEDPNMPDPEQQKKDFQVKNLDNLMRKKKKVAINKKLLARVYNPTVFKSLSVYGTPVGETKTKGGTPTPAYQETKKEFLKSGSRVVNEIARKNIDTNKKIARDAKNDSEIVSLIMEELEHASSLKLKHMLAANTDKASEDYIRHCVTLDKLMKAKAACLERIKDEKQQKAALGKIQTLIDEEVIRIQNTAVKAGKTKKKKPVNNVTTIVKKEETITIKEPEKKEEQVVKKEERVVKKEDNVIKNETVIKRDITKNNDNTIKEPIKKNNTETLDTVKVGTNKVIQKHVDRPEMINVNNGQGVLDIIYYSYNKVDYTIIKRKPKDLKEALELRGQITRNFDVINGAIPDQLVEIYAYYQDYVDQFARTQDLEFDQKVITPVKAEGLNFETVVSLRNRITEGGLLYTDLKGQAKATYDYYDSIVKRLIKGEYYDVVEHPKKQLPNYTVRLRTNLGGNNGLYEKQDSGSNDCWSCAGAGLFNQFVANDANFSKIKTDQKKFRAFRPTLQTYGEMGLDNETYVKLKEDVDRFTINNQKKDRSGSPMGNPYMLADYFLQQFAKSRSYKNTAVRKMVLQPGRAYKYSKGIANSNGGIGKDINAVHNLTVKFMDTVYRALSDGSALTLLHGLHYYTIVGIDGGDLIVHNSLNADPRTTQRLNIQSVMNAYDGAGNVELTWFEKINDPRQITDQYKNIGYDPQTRRFTAKERNFSENIAQKNGVGAWKNLDEKEADIAPLVEDGIYLPQQLA